MGVGRSGTTWLRLALDAHPALAIPAESHVVPLVGGLLGTGEELRDRFLATVIEAPTWPDLATTPEGLRRTLDALEPFTIADGIRALFGLYAASRGKQRWGDKSPSHITAIGLVRALLPESVIVHLIRDGRDVVASMSDQWFRAGTTPEAMATDWVARVRLAREAGHGQPWYLEVRYEDLVVSPTRELARVFARIELEPADVVTEVRHRATRRLEEVADRQLADGAVFSKASRLALHARVAEPLDAARIGRWRTVLPVSHQRRVEAIAGPLLVELGYA